MGAIDKVQQTPLQGAHSASPSPTSLPKSSVDDSMATHPDASTTTSESNCFVTCFIGIKNQIVRFFNWICCLFAKEPTEVEKRRAAIYADLQKVLTDPELDPKVDEPLIALYNGMLEALNRMSNEQLTPDKQIMFEDGMIPYKITKQTVKVFNELRERYSAPVANNPSQATRYLLDLFQIATLLTQFGTLSNEMDETGGIANICQMAEGTELSLRKEFLGCLNDIRAYLSNHETLKDPTTEEWTAVKEWIKQFDENEPPPFWVVTDKSVQKDLSAFAAKLSVESGDEESVDDGG